MKKISIGGQAVIEGVMMRGPKYIATAVRKSSGEIVYKKTKISDTNNKLSKFPFIRGVIMLFEALTIGLQELTFSANESEDIECDKLSKKEAILTTILSIGIGIALFMVLPALIGDYVYPNNKLHSNILEGILRLTFFIVYIWGISISKEVRRVYQYHGAEHKSIYAYENDMELTPQNAKTFTTLHPRCGTSFLIIVMLIAILTFSFVDYLLPTPTTLYSKLLIKVGLRVALMPLIAGIAYELQKYSANHLDNILIKLIAFPGLTLQRITTKEPDLDQLEVAIVAIKASLDKEIDNARDVTKYD